MFEEYNHFVNVIKDYHTMRSGESFDRRCFHFTAADKLGAASALIEWLEGRSEDIPIANHSALKQGRLGGYFNEGCTVSVP